jgi:hypothetical protein
MNIALKLLLFFLGMGLSMLGIMVSLHAPQHMVLGVLISTIWGSLPSYD